MDKIWGKVKENQILHVEGNREETENKVPNKHDLLKGQWNQFALGESQFKEYRHSSEVSEKQWELSKELMSS